VIAEGIENPEQLAAVRAHGAGLGQGYLLGRPSAPVDAAPAVTA
jgi:EAL domain-containing protein (putative c-di-GMP-specific phosphodiesterase class I)